MDRFGSLIVIFTLITSAAALTTACGSNDVASDPSVVQTEQGLAKGTVANGVSEFLGLPYAAPPVGPLRWKPPTAAAHYTGTYNASTARSQCVQGSATAATGSEDCLYLNIYRPRNAASTSALPVIFAIHGGGFAVGSSAFIDGTSLAKNDNVIVVSINYRLNALGFLAHPALTAEDTQHASGNYGLLDQNAALSWVKRNIAAFGGNPDNITITGGSAGGISVFTHMVSPMSAGLFAKAAPQSGGFTRVQATLAQAESDGVSFTSQWGCTTGSSADIAACLRNVPAAATLQNNPPAWLPNVDGRFLTMSTSVTFSTGQFNKVPIMTGFVDDEGTYFVAAAFDANGQPVTSSGYVPTIQGFLGVDGNATAALYPLSQYKSPSQALARVYGDYRVICGIMQDTDNIARFAPSAFVYQFSEKTPYSTNTLISTLPPTNIDYGAFHGSDTDYWFAQMVNPTASQTQLATTMSTSIANFARSGNPGVTGTPQWQQYSGANRQVFSFGDTLNANFDAYTAHQCAYWYQQTPSTHL
ncbi:Fumonisin B1 esterase [Paraburkholderia aspalathi]|nr:Fumonisin B1 esterase [Paraburkholderia aspalathi]